MTEREAIKVRREYNKLNLTSDEEHTIYKCYMQGVNRDGHVWVTWTDVQKMIVDLCDWKGRLHND